MMRKLTPNKPQWLYEQNRQHRPAEAFQAEASVVQDLRAVGLDVESVWDLVHTNDSYPEAIPVLVKHLRLPYPKGIKEGIIRALLVREARNIANQAVLEEYHCLPKDKLNKQNRWLLGCVMYSIMNWEDLDQVIAIVADDSNGDSRSDFIRALGKWKQPEKCAIILQKAGAILERLVKEGDKEGQWLSKEAQKVLDRLRKAGK